MKITAKVAHEGDAENWWRETWTTNAVQDPEEYAALLVGSFNKSLREGERPRVLLGILEVDEGWREHDWRKTNLVTVMVPGGGASYDTYQCAACGVTGKRYALDRDVTRDSPYRHKVYDLCNTAQAHMKKKGGRT